MDTPSFARRGRGAAHSAHDSKTLTALVAVGLVAYGVVHLLIAWLSLQVAWGHQRKNTSNAGAVHTLATQPFGTPLLWISAFGFVALAAWQGLEATIGHENNDDTKKLLKRLVSAGRVILYLALAGLFVKAATGSGGNSKSKQTWTAELMNRTGGQLLVALVGLAIIGVGIGLFVVAAKKTFEKRIGNDVLSGQSGDVVVKLGQAGYIAKGVALGVVGALFVWAAWTYDPKKAGGLDRALKTLLDQPFGQLLLTVVALGFACFGLFCFAWARSPETT